MKPAALTLEHVSYRYGPSAALADVSVAFRPGVITGLIGRNGAGKSTLAALASGFRRPQQGTITLDGQPVWENPAATSRVCFMRDSGGLIEDERIDHSLNMMRALRPHWDQDYFWYLAGTFGLPRRRLRPDKLSRGQRSALAAAVALASRCELTIVDEIHLGMDAVARRLFYEALLADYIAHPRTFIVSSHLLDEIEDQLEDVVVLHQGRVAAAGAADDVRRQYSTDAGLASLTDVLVTISGGMR